MTTRCHIAHTCGGRTRLRWQGAASDSSAMLELAAAIAELDMVERVDPRPTTGSIIIEHPDADWRNLATQLIEQLNLEFVEPAPRPARSGLAVLNSGLDEISTALKEGSGNGLDLRTLTFLLLVGLAVAQAARGQVMVSAASLLWYAMSVATKKPTETPPEEAGD